MYAFDYCRVRSLGEAETALADDNARLLAGGMSLIPVLKHRLAAPTLLVDIGKLDELRTIRTGNGTISIGAMTTHYAVATSEVVRKAIPALAALADSIGDPLVRNRGTIGGSLAFNDPAACYPSALLGLGGTVITNRRRIAGDKYILGTFQTALEPGEIITAVEFPVPDCAAHIKFANFASRFSIVGVFVSRRNGQVRVGVTGAGPCAFRAAALEQALTGDFSLVVVEGLQVPAGELISDIHASAEYRAHLVSELTSRAVAQCLAGTPEAP
jgi:aerobic carbon-monoxide dehydrogenase medium subunit